MRKILKLLSRGTFISSMGLITTACNGSWLGGGNLKPGEPEKPEERTIEYYEALIKEQETYLIDCDEALAEIEANKDGYDDEQDYQDALDEVKAEKFYCQALINEYQYQILELQKKNDKFTLEQILQGITIFTEQELYLEKELELKENINKNSPGYFTEEELQIIKDAIATAKNKLAYFLDLKDKEEEKENKENRESKESKESKE